MGRFAWVPGSGLRSFLDMIFRSRLLYGLFLSGDGNFKLQRRSKRSALRLYTAAASTFKDSLFGDRGFWAPQSENDKYLMDANPAQDLQNKVRSAAFALLVLQPY